MKVDADKKRVIVGPKEALDCQRFTIRKVNWLLGSSDRQGVRALVKMRSAQSPVPARIVPDESGGAVVELEMPQAAVAPGQACVMYEGSRVLGGGWITAT